MASGMATRRVRRGSDPGGHGPVGEAWRRRRPGKTTFRVPGASALRALSSKTANDRLSLSQSFVSRPKFRLPLEISSRARSSYLYPSHFCICIFCFVMPGRRGGNGEREHTLFWHDVEIFPPKMTKKGPRPRVCQSAPGVVKTVIGTCDGVRCPPNPGWCRKIGAIRSLILYRAT